MGQSIPLISPADATAARQDAVRSDIAEARAHEIIALAESVADKYCPTGRVEPETIIRGEGILLMYGRFGNAFDGIIDYVADQFQIRCNLDRENLPNSPRARFTLAHELAHYFINEHRKGIISGALTPKPSCGDTHFSGKVPFEREADLFAANLLIPPKRFTAFLRRARKRLSGVLDICEKFHVSASCAAIRYVQDEVEPSVLIHWVSRWAPVELVFRAVPRLELRQFDPNCRHSS
jgi:hypothetical protein